MESKLYDACKNGNLKEVKKIYKKMDAKELLEDYMVDQAFSIACENCHLNIMQYLDEKYGINDIIESVLESIFKRCNIDVILYVLQLDAVFDADNVVLAFRCLCDSGNIEAAKIFKEHADGLNSDDFCEEDIIALCSNGKLETLKYLISIDFVDIEHNINQILYANAKAGHIEIVKYLCDFENIDISYNNYAMLKVSSGEVIKFLKTKYNVD